jgi:hypothetical protein
MAKYDMAPCDYLRRDSFQGDVGQLEPIGKASAFSPLANLSRPFRQLDGPTRQSCAADDYALNLANCTRILCA